LSSQTLCRHTRPPQAAAAAQSTPPRIILLETNDDLSDAAAALTRKVNQEHCSRFVMLAHAAAAAAVHNDDDDDDDDGDDNHHDQCHSSGSVVPHTLLLCTCVASAADDITSGANAAPPHPLPSAPSAATAMSAVARACRARLKAGDRVPPYERGCLLLLLTALQSGADVAGDGGSNRLQLLLACAALSDDACVPAIRLLQPTLSSLPLLHLISPPPSGTRSQLQQPLVTMLLILVVLARDDVCKGDQ
jgi:hypothetical protein